MSGIKPDWIAGRSFVMLHRDLVEALDGDLNSAIVVDRIRYHAGDGWWRATKAEMMHETMLTENRLRRSIKVLEDAGYIEVTRSGPYDATLKYRLIVEDENHKVDPVETTGSDAVETTGSSLEKRTPPVVPPSGDETPALFATETPGPPAPVAAAPQGPMFEDFYALYPKKVDRAAAHRAWAKVVRDGADPSVILAGLRQQLPEMQAKIERGERRFIKGPGPWLNAEAWLNEIEETKGGGLSWDEMERLSGG